MNRIIQKKVNSKSEIRNTKQIRITETQNSKHLYPQPMSFFLDIKSRDKIQKGGLRRGYFGHLKLEFRYCLGFRY